MDVVFRVQSLSEPTAVDLLNLLARHNRRYLVRDPRFPLLYDSGVVYVRESVELWGDAPSTLAQGHEDCDALSAWRAGELLARGAGALRPGEAGFEQASKARLMSIPAEVMMTTRTKPGESGMYHCIVRYKVGDAWFRDDPSARLGMYRGQVDARILERWRRAGVTARAPLEVR
jgi:hypothetical protein